MWGRWKGESISKYTSTNLKYLLEHEESLKPIWPHQTIELLGDTFFYTLAKLIPGFLTLISISILIRILGAEQYGYWAICNAMMMFILSFCFGWIRQAILRFKSGSNKYIEFSRNKAPVGAINFGVILTLSIGITSLILLKLVFNNHWITGSVIIYLLLYIIFFGVFNVWGSYLQAWRQRSEMVISESLKAILVTILSICLAIYWGVSGVLAGYAVGSFIAASCLGLFLKKDYALNIIDVQTYKKPKQKDPDYWANWWEYGWPVSVWLSLLAFIPIVDRVLIQSYLGIVKSGVYAASYDIIARGYSLFLFPFTLAVHPRVMAATNTGDHKIVNQQINHAKIIALGIVLISLLGILLLYPIFFKYIVKVEPQTVLPRIILALITLGSGGWQIALLAHKPLEIANKTKLMVFGLVIALVVHISVQIVFLKSIGVLATAIALVLSSVTYIFFCRYWSEKLGNNTSQNSPRSIYE